MSSVDASAFFFPAVSLYTEQHKKQHGTSPSDLNANLTHHHRGCLKHRWVWLENDGIIISIYCAKKKSEITEMKKTYFQWKSTADRVIYGTSYRDRSLHLSLHFRITHPVTFRSVKWTCNSFLRMSHWGYFIVKTSSWEQNHTALKYEKSILISHQQHISWMKPNDSWFTRRVVW